MEHSHAHLHADPAAGITLLGAAALIIVFSAAIAYVRGVLHLQQDGRGWPRARTAAFLAGAALLAIGLAPPLVQAAMSDFRLHMLQHLLIGMFAPLGLVLGAPVSLLLRRLSRRHVRLLLGLLRGGWIRFVAQPFIALLLNTGGMYLLYLTPLYMTMHGSLPLNAFVHMHVVLAGCLFTWSMLNGPDPVPRRHAIRVRLAAVFIGIAAHTLLGKLMYAYGLPAGMHPRDEIEQGAQWMYYGGDLAELLLLTAMFARWRAAPKAARFFRDEIHSVSHATTSSPPTPAVRAH
ncbi:MAG: cytochrome c oxidase assembly protein [Gammaproteobacteria bacterium]